SARSLSDKREVINSPDISVLRKAPMSCSAKRLRRSFSHRESVVSQKNNESNLSDTTLGDAYYYLGLLNKIIGNLQTAEDYLLKATKFSQTFATAYHCLGQISLARGNYHQAVKHFKKALERNPRSSETRVLLSAAYRKMHKYIDAEKMIKSVFEDEPTNYFAAFEQHLINTNALIFVTSYPFSPSPPHQVRGRLQSSPLRGEGGVRGDEEQSYLELACLYINSGLYQDAITLMEMIDGEKSPMSLFYLGYLYNKIGKREKGKEFYGNALKTKNYQHLFPNRLEEFAILKDAIENSEDNFITRYAMGNFLASRYRFSEALEQWNKSAQKIENLKNEEKMSYSDLLTVLYRNIGLIIWKIQKKPEEAVSWYEKALSYGGWHFQCYKELSDLYGEIKQKEKAIAILESGLDKVSKPSEIVRELLPLYSEKGNFKLMEEIISKYPADHWHRFEFQSWHRTIYLTKGKKLFDDGKYLEATSEFDRAMEYPENIRITKEPLHNFAEILWYKGLAYSKMNNLPEAFKCWNQAANEAHGALEMNRLYQAKILKKLSEILLDEVISMAGANIKMHPEEEANPWFANLYFLRGLAYEEKGQIEKAIKAYKKALELNPEHQQAKERLQKLEK
ncbi:MAG: tetratricopeptide repeat protein, partial [Acidobacteriota bacterium]